MVGDIDKPVQASNAQQLPALFGSYVVQPNRRGHIEERWIAHAAQPAAIDLAIRARWGTPVQSWARGQWVRFSPGPQHDPLHRP